MESTTIPKAKCAAKKREISFVKSTFAGWTSQQQTSQERRHSLMYRFPTVKHLILETKYDFEIRPQINDWRQGNFRLSSGRRLRGAPGQQAFQDARKSAYLCGKMRVQFCLRKMNRLTKCNGDACATGPDLILKSPVEVMRLKPTSLRHSGMAKKKPAGLTMGSPWKRRADGW